MPSADDRAALRVAVICAGTTVAAWQARCLDALLAVVGVQQLVLITETGKARPDHPDRQTRPAPLWSAFRNGYVARRSAALRPVAIDGCMAGVTRLRSDDEALPALLAPLGLDVVLHLGRAAVPASIARMARRGVWSLHTGGSRANDPSGAAGFHEFLEGTAVTTAELRSQSGPDGATGLLGHAVFGTRSHSYVRTLDNVLFGAAALPARACHTILAGAEPMPLSDRERHCPRVPEAPTNRDVLALTARLCANFVRSQLRAIALSPQWNAGVVDAPIERFLDASFEPRVQWLPKAPRGHFVADPFGVQDGSAKEWLVESYDYTTDRGVITVVNPRDTDAPRGTTLPVDTHASYPYLVRHHDHVYCVPQLDLSQGIRIFRAEKYPTEWVDAGVLVADVTARDPTLFEHEGRWWLMYTDATAPFTDLHVWWADDLFDDWHPHAANPVKIDARSARPAGTPFVHAGALYRPAQDCSESYGGAVAICRIDVLTPTEFREEVVRVIRSLPGAYRRGTHTLASVGATTLVDGKRYTVTLAGTRHALRSRLQRSSS